MIGFGEWTALAGLPALTALGMLQALAHRRRDLRQARAYAEAVERLHAVTAAISAKLGSGDDVLGELAAAAAKLVGMRIVRISVVDRNVEGASVLRCLASVGRQPDQLRDDFRLSELPIGRIALAEKRMLVVEDVDHTKMPIEAMRRMGVRSLMLVPLLVEGRTIGMLSLGDEHRHTFTPEQQRLGQLLGAQAAVILANAQLHAQAQAALAAQRRLLVQRERLSTITAAIYAQTTFQATLAALVKLAPSLLDVDGCAVLMCVPPADAQCQEPDLVLMHATPPYDTLAGRRFSAKVASYEQTFQSRRPRVVTNTRLESNLHPIWQSLPDVKSFLSVPLYHSDGRPLGLLVLTRATVGVFGEEQIELAQVLGARAAVAVENAHLHQRSRADAAAKAMLLRELNHRVKNNLAGITGLLEAAEADVAVDAEPALARQVLARLADRVRVMASTHELFVGGVAASGRTDVALPQLAEQVLASLGIGNNAEHVGPAAYQEWAAAEQVRLRSDRAVSFAMALHELASNAIVHGCGRHGQLQVLARRIDSPSAALLVEVIDDGSVASRGATADPAAAPADGETAEGKNPAGATLGWPRTGIGLQLVRGLVCRELHGQFVLEPVAPAGTRAAMQIPLLADELGQTPPTDVGADLEVSA